MKTPRLSICIATYNRADVIGQTLDSIIAQIRDEVEIVIVDGASTDNTTDVMRRYQACCPSLRYYRMPVKGGVDQDYCHALSFATGEYCWLLTDDDIIKPGAIDTVLSLIPNRYSLIVINAEVWDKTFTKKLENKHLHVKENAFYAPEAVENLFVNTVTYLSFIGAVIIDRAIWNNRLTTPYIGTEFIHVGVIFQKKLPGGAFVLAEPLISIRYGNAQWTPRQFEIWLIKWPELIWSFSGISDSSKRRICPLIHPWKSMATLLMMRAYGGYSIVEYKRFIANRPGSRPQKFLAKAISLFPGIISNACCLIYYTARSSNDFISLHSLRTSRFYYRQYIRDTIERVVKVLKLKILDDNS